MRIIPNPVKESSNRAKHRLDFSRVAEILAGPVLQRPDDRPLGYEQEGRLRVIGRLGMRVVVLVFEPVETTADEMAVRPISLRKATREEEQRYWRVYG